MDADGVIMDAMKHVQSQPKPINLEPELIAKCDGPDQFEKFDQFFRAVIAVPKATIDKQEAKWKRARTRSKLKKQIL